MNTPPVTPVSIGGVIDRRPRRFFWCGVTTVCARRRCRLRRAKPEVGKDYLTRRKKDMLRQRRRLDRERWRIRVANGATTIQTRRLTTDSSNIDSKEEVAHQTVRPGETHTCQLESLQRCLSCITFTGFTQRVCSCGRNVRSAIAVKQLSELLGHWAKAPSGGAP